MIEDSPNNSDETRPGGCRESGTCGEARKLRGTASEPEPSIFDLVGFVPLRSEVGAGPRGRGAPKNVAPATIE
jgi:hypothetical protein